MIARMETDFLIHKPWKSLFTCIYIFSFQIRSYKLVSEDGIIRPEVFYKALTVWIDRDVLGYAFSQVRRESDVCRT